MLLLEIGRVAKTRGLKGTMKVASFLRGDDALLFLKEVFAARAVAVHTAASAQIGAPVKATTSITGSVNVTNGLVELDRAALESYPIKKVSPHHGACFFIDLAGVEDCSGASALIGASLLIAPSQLPKIPAGEYYWFELLGMEIVSTQGARLGKLVAIFPTGSNDVYVCRAEGKEILLPAIPECVLDIDIEQKTMTVELGGGYGEL